MDCYLLWLLLARPAAMLIKTKQAKWDISNKGRPVIRQMNPEPFFAQNKRETP